MPHRQRWPLIFFLVILLLLGAVAYFLWRPAAALPLRVGVLHALTGTMALSEAPLVDALRLAAEEINAAGGLLGRPVELVIADTRSDDALAAQTAERLITTERVDVLFGCWTSACRKAVKPVVERHRHLLFYSVQYEGMERSNHILYAGATPNQQVVPGTRWALAHFGKRLVLVGSDYVFPRAANHIIRDIAGVSGGTVLAERYRPLGDGDWAAVIDEIRRLKPDAVLSTINGDSNTAFFHALHQAGLADTPVFSFSLAEAELQAMGRECFHPRHYAVWGYFQSLPGAENARFVAAFKARFGADRVVSDPLVASYNALKLWANTVRETGAADLEVINLALLRQSVPGPAGVVAVDAATRHTWRPVLIGHAGEDGQYEVLHTSDTLVRPAPFMSHRSQTEWLTLVEQAERTSAAP